ncbi:MAG: helix-turn-helix domain-containing protein [Pseudonocardiaceae bacterium]|nr:helix-turn-helix domain-containing protein [Pseudonocardiaceae bacterium]
MPPVAELNPQRVRLAARLRALRTAAFPSGNQFAYHIGWGQSKVSKLETGAQRPTEDDVRQWVHATGNGADVEAELLAMAAAARFEYATVRDAVRQGGGIAAWQAQIAALESATTHIAEHQPVMLPGIVQTAAYTRELLALHGGPLTAGASEDEVEALVAGRIRRQEILYQPGRSIQLVIGEAALHDPPGSVETLVGQLDRLVAVAGLASVDLAVLRLGTRMPVLPLSSFTAHDKRVVFVETMTGEQRLDEPDEVAVYVKAFDLLRAAAATGSDAVALIQQVAAQLRGCTPPFTSPAQEG